MFFTIGLPITKGEFLKSTIESIINQSFDDFEVIFQNNASTPEKRAKILDIIVPFLSDPRFKYYENETLLPIYDNFNKVLKNASGEYFIILSDDDKLTPDCLYNFNKLINLNKEVYVYHCRVKLINENDKLIEYSPLCNAFETLPDYLYHRLTAKRVQFLSDFVVNTSQLKAIGGFPVFPLGWGLDDLTWYLLAENGIAYTDYIGLEYRVISNNFSNSKQNFRKRLDDIVFFHEQLDKITSSEAFLSKSIYPRDMVTKAIVKAHNKDYNYLFKMIAKSGSIFSMVNFFYSNKKKYNIKNTSLLYGFYSKYYKR